MLRNEPPPWRARVRDLISSLDEAVVTYYGRDPAASGDDSLSRRVRDLQGELARVLAGVRLHSGDLRRDGPQLDGV
jgi:hypothetical protein